MLLPSQHKYDNHAPSGRSNADIMICQAWLLPVLNSGWLPSKNIRNLLMRKCNLTMRLALAGSPMLGQNLHVMIACQYDGVTKYSPLSGS